MTIPSNPDLIAWRHGGRYESFNGAEVDGLHDTPRLFLREEGSGEALLLVHGFPTAAWDWHLVWSGLASKFRVIAADMLGYGFSDKPVIAYGTALQAALQDALLVRLGVREVHVMTYSFGSSVVQEMMARDLERRAIGETGPRIQSLTFLNGGLFPESNHPNLIQRLLLSPLGFLVRRLITEKTLGRGLRKIFGPYTQPADQLITDYWELVRNNQGNRIMHLLIRYLRDRQVLGTRWREALLNHPAPQLLVVGMTDPISGPEMAAQYRNFVPEPNILEWENIGHYPQLEAPDRLLKAYDEFRARI